MDLIRSGVTHCRSQEKDKTIEESKKSLAEKDKEIEELKRQLGK